MEGVVELPPEAGDWDPEADIAAAVAEYEDPRVYQVRHFVSRSWGRRRHKNGTIVSRKRPATEIVLIRYGRRAWTYTSDWGCVDRVAREIYPFDPDPYRRMLEEIEKELRKP